MPLSMYHSTRRAIRSFFFSLLLFHGLFQHCLSDSVKILFPGSFVRGSTAGKRNFVSLDGFLNGQALFEVRFPQDPDGSEPALQKLVSVTTCSQYTKFDTILMAFQSDPRKHSEGKSSPNATNDNDCGLQSTLEITISSVASVFVLLTGYRGAVGEFGILVKEVDSHVSDGVPWGLDRIDQRALPLDGRFSIRHGGVGVLVYVLDSGVRASHSEFLRQDGSSRVRFGADLVDRLGHSTDITGHGTHVAAIVAGNQFGVAKNATIVSVRVLGRDSVGHTSQLVEGVLWALNDIRRKGNKPAVLVMSLSAPQSEILNDVVNKVTSFGVAVVTAAGNDGSDSCVNSPASSNSTFTVAATTRTDSGLHISNFGDCVDMYAPGEDILSAWHTGDFATKRLSGTSAACPHVAGAVAVLLAENPSLSPAESFAVLVSTSTILTVQNHETRGEQEKEHKSRTNRLLYVRQIPKVQSDGNPKRGRFFMYVIFKLDTTVHPSPYCWLSSEHSERIKKQLTAVLSIRSLLHVTLKVCCSKAKDSGCDSGELFPGQRLILRVETRMVDAETAFKRLTHVSTTEKLMQRIGFLFQSEVSLVSEPWVVDSRGFKYWAAPSLAQLSESVSSRRRVLTSTGISIAVLFTAAVFVIFCFAKRRRRHAIARQEQFERKTEEFEAGKLRQSNIANLDEPHIEQTQGEGLKRENSDLQGSVLHRVLPLGALPTPRMSPNKAPKPTQDATPLARLRNSVYGLFKGPSYPPLRSTDQLQGQTEASRLDDDERSQQGTFFSTFTRLFSPREGDRNRYLPSPGRPNMYPVRVLSYGPGRGALVRPNSPQGGVPSTEITPAEQPG